MLGTALGIVARARRGRGEAGGAFRLVECPPIPAQIVSLPRPRQGHDNAALAEFFEVVSPPRHHPDSLLPMLATVIHAADRILICMRELPLDRVRTPQSTFIQERARRAS